MYTVRSCRKGECSLIIETINAAAEVYRGVIPADRWHDPYMSLQELDAEIAAGVVFWAYDSVGEVLGVMGIQPVRDVDLIRHAYVRPGNQRRGIGAALIGHMRSLSISQMLIGTWASAAWAIAFYQRHGFVLVSSEQKTVLLNSYWTIPARQIETSVVLANPPMLVNA